MILERVEKAVLLDNLPADKGSYLLVYFQTTLMEMNVGRIGNCVFQPGYYIYCGSAKGPGGLRARIKHHINPSFTPHWHIDYFKQYAELAVVGYTTDLDIFECKWSKMFEKSSHFKIVKAGFGASDCACKTHFYFSGNPLDFITDELNIPELIFLNKKAGNSP